MKVTVDTNVLISGTFWNGDSYRLICLISKGLLDCVISPAIIDEYARVLRSEEITKKGLLPDISGVVGGMLQKSILVHPQIALMMVPEDPSDNRILECAVEGKAEYLITQDNHLLKLKEFQGIRIVTPKDFLKHKSF